MRQIGTLSHENYARKLSRCLTHRGIGNKCEVVFDAPTGQMSYQIWILEEDKIQEAISIFQEFEKNPAGSKFDAPEMEPEMVSEDRETAAPPVRRFGSHLTHFLIGLCAIVFFFNLLQINELRKLGWLGQSAPLTSLMALLMFDLPPGFEEMGNIVEKYKTAPNNYETLIQVKNEIDAASQIPYWQGIYNWILAKIKGEDPASGEGPLFIQIRKGELWRLVSPCILHKDLLHILFNMLWLWYLGKPVEQRIGPMRTFFLSLIAGAGSNTIQYLMSGPFFIGYSGIITALAGFIWMRERLAPWEGYPLNRSTILFLLFFIAAIFALQVVSFFIQIFTSYHFAPNIANTAHIAGAIIGALLAKSSFFAQRVKS